MLRPKTVQTPSIKMFWNFEETVFFLKICLFDCNVNGCKLIAYDVPKAANVPFGISVDGARKSPLILMPDKTPVIVGKKMPNTRNQLYPSL